MARLIHVILARTSRDLRCSHGFRFACLLALHHLYVWTLFHYILLLLLLAPG